MPKDFIEKFNILNREQGRLAKEFEKMYTDVYPNEASVFEEIKKVISITTFSNCITVELSVDIKDIHEEYIYDDECGIDLPLDFFSNYNEYLEDKNKKEQENISAKKLKDIEKLKKEIANKTEKLNILLEDI